MKLYSQERNRIKKGGKKMKREERRRDKRERKRESKREEKECGNFTGICAFSKLLLTNSNTVATNLP